MPHRIAVLPLALALVAVAGCTAVGDLTGGEATVQITNKIPSLPAGRTYVFNVTQHPDSTAPLKVALLGEGTAVASGQTVIYIAPPAPPIPNTVTLTVTAANGAGLSDFDTFSIGAPAGPVVAIAPQTFYLTAGGGPFTLTVTVTQDSAADVLTAMAESSADCSGSCGSFSAFIGDPGSGAYTVDYTPPATVTKMTVQQLTVLSSLAGSTPGVAFVTIAPQ
jgi:hypothetical protein